MSSATLAWAWTLISQKQIETESAKLALLRLADDADSSGIFLQPVEVLAQRLGTCCRTASRALAILEKAGLVTVKKNFDGRGRQLANVVHLRYPHASDNMAPASAKSSPLRGDKVCHPQRDDKLSPPVVVVLGSSENNNNSGLHFDEALLSPGEVSLALQAVRTAPTVRQQILLDEIFGQARIKKNSIRNFGAWARSIVSSDCRAQWAGEHFYAMDEAALYASGAAKRMREAEAMRFAEFTTPEGTARGKALAAAVLSRIKSQS